MQRSITRVLVFLALVAGGIGVRVWFRDLPNFAPVAALALFAGYYFHSRAVAVSVPLLVMTLSDTVIGSYDTRMMALVYGSLALPVAWRGWLRQWFRLEGNGWSEALASSTGLLACGILSSLLFFLLTNFGAWVWHDMYPHTAAGLARCYAQALPFFRNTLMGDAFFATALFGGYALALQAMKARQPTLGLAARG